MLLSTFLYVFGSSFLAFTLCIVKKNQKKKNRSHASTGQRYYELACVICCGLPRVRHIVTVTRLFVVSQFD